MNKQEIVQQIAEYAHLSRAEAAAALDGFVRIVSDALAKRHRVHINGFGTFQVNDAPPPASRGLAGEGPVGFVPDPPPAFKAGVKLSEKMPRNPRKTIRPDSYQTENYMAVLVALRNLTGYENVTDLPLAENRSAIRAAIGMLPAASFSLQQWRVAARYLVGKKVAFSGREAVVDFLLDELGAG